MKPDAIVWRGDTSLPSEKQGIKVLGAPVGHPAFVREHLEKKSREQAELFQKIPHIEDTQACWLLLLMCAATRANFWLRMVRPEDTLEFAERHDDRVWECLRAILGTPAAPVSAKVLAQLPLSMGGLGLTSAVQTRVAAHWASWADSISMVRKRHPTIADAMIAGIDRGPAPCFQSVRNCEHALAEAGLAIPSWVEMAATPPSAAT